MTCYIFWNIDEIKFVPVPANKESDVSIENLIEEVRVERTDSDFDLQLRMWH